MKQRVTTPVSNINTAKISKSIGIAAVLVLALVLPLFSQPHVAADKYDDQIQALQREIDQYQAKAGQLKNQIDSLQNELAGIESQKRVIQAQIDISQARYDKLQVQIKTTEQKIKDNKQALGITLADLYVDNKVSPLEMLASSKTIGDYVDKQEYRSSVREQLSKKITSIKKLKKELEKQRTDVQRTLADQTNSRKALTDKEAERGVILARTRGQESAYQQLSSERLAQKLKVQQQQQASIEAAIANAGGSGVILPGTSGGYPWNESNCYVDSNAWSHGGIDGNGTDGLGYGCRQCVSYVAWRAYKETGYAPAYWGNAYDWPQSARGAGFTVTSQPRERSAAVITSGGSPGHVVWVESVDTVSGKMIVSQYNYYNAGGSGWGHYSKMQVPIGTYQQYIYF